MSNPIRPGLSRVGIGIGLPAPGVNGGFQAFCCDFPGGPLYLRRGYPLFTSPLWERDMRVPVFNCEYFS